jgi:hypothetical protein
MTSMRSMLNKLEVKRSDDISAEVDDEKNVNVIGGLIFSGVKTLCLSK